MSEPDALMYCRVFEGHAEGALILEDLTKRFYDRPSFVQGQPDTVAFNEGRRAVLAFILGRLAQVAEEVTDERTAQR